jgi:ABC-type multidrug transport system fused ATPase/permease subunit
MNGRVTIRAFNNQEHLIQRNEEILDTSQQPFYLLWSLQRLLVLILDLIAALVAVCLVSIIVASPGNFSAGSTGIALVNLMMLSNTMMEVVLAWTVMETSISSVSRIMMFTKSIDLKTGRAESMTLPQGWPTSGEIILQRVSATYK